MPRSLHSSPASSSACIGPTPETKSNRKYWGDEATEDAIYSVYMKKITYSGHQLSTPSRQSAYFQPSPFAPSTNESINSHAFNPSCDSSTTSEIVDGIQRVVFRRRSSFDRQRDSSGSSTVYNGNCKRNNRSASVASPFYHLTRSSTASDILVKQKSDVANIRMKNYTKFENEKDQTDFSPSSTTSQRKNDSQLLQWETRRIRILKAGTLSHIIQYMLMITPGQLQLANCNSSSPSEESGSNHCQSIVMEEERNNVSHIIHVMYVSYRLFASPESLFNEILKHYNAIKPQPPHLVKQFNFLLHYWLTNYPEDFAYIVSEGGQNGQPNGRRSSSSSGKSDCNQTNGEASSLTSNESYNQLKSLPVTVACETKAKESSCPSSTASSPSHFIRRRSKSRERRKKLESGVNKSISRSVSSDARAYAVVNGHKSSNRRLLDVLLQEKIDHSIYAKALSVYQELKDSDCDSSTLLFTPAINGKYANQSQANNNLLELDARFVASQLTAIDLENFVALKAYHLLEGTRSTVPVQNTVKYFNLLSRRVVITILKSPTPDLVTAHWIEIALQLRRIKNFNSLKAVISGLTNESIYRLKNAIWSKLGKTTLSNFKMLSSIVDDVDNQTVLRQTQLEVTKSSDNSFGTIPYLGTFFTDLTVIDSRYSSTLPSKTGEKLINLEKCSKQFEVITQVQLLQKNVKASLDAHNKAQSIKGTSNINTDQNSPLPKQVARIFREWFNEEANNILSENECYKISLNIEPPTPKK